MSRYILRKIEPRVYYSREAAEDAARAIGGVKVVELVPKRFAPDLPTVLASYRRGVLLEVVKRLQNAGLYLAAAAVEGLCQRDLV